MTHRTPIKPDTEDYIAVHADPMNQGKPDAEMYRLAQATKMLRLFEQAHGRPARDTEELTAWVVGGGLDAA